MKKKNKKINVTAEIVRSMTFDITRANKNGIPVTISTENPVRTFMGNEVLVHEPGAVDLTRAKEKGLPILVDHYGEVVGRVFEVALNDRRLEGVAVLSRSERGKQLEKDILDKIITDVSVGGERIEIEEPVDNVYRVTRWRPTECSLTAIGLDEESGLFRSKIKQEEEPMKKKLSPEALAAQEEGKQIERARRTEINSLFNPYNKDEAAITICRSCLDDETTIERARELLLDHLGSKQEPTQKTPSSFLIGETDQEKAAQGIERALTVQTGLATDEEKKEIGNNPFTSFTPVEMARSFLTANNVSVMGLSRHDVVGEAMILRNVVHGSATSSDFPNILANVSNKAMLLGYNEVPETWQEWCRVGNIQDFKQAHRVNLSAFNDLEEIPEYGEYDHGEFSDLAEYIKLLTYGKLFTISRQALINDDLSALSAIPRSMGRSAARKVGDLVYNDVLIGNPTLNQDGTPVFDNLHNNATDYGAPSVEALDYMRVAMAKQTDPSGNAVLGILPQFIIAPIELGGTIRTLIAAQYDPAADAGTLTPNPEQGRLKLIEEHRLSADSADQFYVAASNTQADTVEVAFLNGNNAPYLEQQEGFTRDGVTHKVRIDAAAAPMDFRGMAVNPGTTTAEAARKAGEAMKAKKAAKGKKK